MSDYDRQVQQIRDYNQPILDEVNVTPKKKDEIRKRSSRVQLTSTQTTFLYNYGD